MAIAPPEAVFLLTALRMGLLPTGRDVLEFGESELSVDPLAVLDWFEPYLPATRVATARARFMVDRYDRGVAWDRPSVGTPTPLDYHHAYEPARVFYRAVFDPRSYTAIDINPPIYDHWLQVDLNEPFAHDRRYGVVINNGTAEHIFDQANFYRTMHELTAPGGVMLHWGPCVGWYDHGFYANQPGLLLDLAKANDYEVKLIGLALEDAWLPIDPVEQILPFVTERSQTEPVPGIMDEAASLCAVLVRRGDVPFRVPFQETYLSGGQVRLLRRISRLEKTT